MNGQPEFKRDPLPLPPGHDTVLHSCRAPCRGEVMVASGIDYTIVVYNPNSRSSGRSPVPMDWRLACRSTPLMRNANAGDDP